MSPVIRALLAPAGVTAVMFVALVSLGAWQLRRLDAKEALIARVEERFSEAPVDLPPQADWAALKFPDFEYRHVRVSGHFEPGRDALVYAITPQGFGSEPGFFVVTPFRLDSGGLVLVERGFLPQSKSVDPARRTPPPGETTLTARMRAPQSRNSFTPADDPARNIWYTRDPAAMAAAMGLTGVAPFTLALDAAGAVSADEPRPVPGKPEFANNHLSYAFTWFSLALADLIIFALYARGVLARAR